MLKNLPLSPAADKRNSFQRNERTANPADPFGVRPSLPAFHGFPATVSSAAAFSGTALSGQSRDHSFLKPEHAAALFIGFFVAGFRVVRIRMMAVKELDNMEAA